MVDRVPLYPGRVKLVPVAGQENTYDMVRADNPTQEGTPLNKATLLKDATAALFGLGADAVPDDVLSILSNSAMHWWSKAKVKSYGRVSLGSSESQFTLTGSNINTKVTIGTVSADIFGNLSFTAVKTGNVSYNNPELAISDFRGSYFMVDGSYDGIQNNIGKIYYADPAVEYSYGSSGKYVHLFGTISEVNGAAGSLSKSVEYVKSANRNEYPDHDVREDFFYTYLGLPNNELTNLYKIEVGTYVGTGLYGKDNRNSLSFGFNPRIVLINEENSKTLEALAWAEKEEQVTNVIVGNVCLWYRTSSASSQYNSSGSRYYYIAIG